MVIFKDDTDIRSNSFHTYCVCWMNMWLEALLCVTCQEIYIKFTKKHLLQVKLKL